VTAEDLTVPQLLGLGAAILAIGIVAGLWLSRATGWGPAGGLALLVATPLIPHVPVVGGLSLDDLLPLLGIGFLVATVDWRRITAVKVPWLLVIGLALAIAAGIVSSIANAASISDAIVMMLRSPGRYAYLAVIVTLVALAEPADRRRLLVARGMALMGMTEAVVGLAGFFLPLGGLALEPTRKFSVLYFEVPGRIAGTLGISPNFLGAIFILTIVITMGLAIETTDRRERMLWWAAVLLQSLALTLTFTRASLALALFAVFVLLLLRGRLRYLLPVLLVVALGFLTTPTPPDDSGGTTGSPLAGTPVAVQRLTDDVPDRLALWYSAVEMMVDHPLTGVGPGRMIEVQQSNPARYIKTPVGSAQNNAHNTILLAGAELGVVGAIGAFLVNLAIGLAGLGAVIRGWRRQIGVVETAGAIAVLGYLAQGMVNNLFNVAAAGVVFAVVAGAYVIRLEAAPSARSAVGDVQRQRAPTGPPLEPTV
jgi:O-antigen ligase